MKCLECHVETKPLKIERYHYSECGLKNIYLTDMKAMECPHCNDQEIFLPNIENLHALIAKNIASQASRLKSEEIRFLRVHLGLSGIDFAQAVSVEPETVSRWENGRSEMKLTNERLLRILILSKAGPFRDYKELGEFGTSSKKSRPHLQFAVKGDQWRQFAAA